MKQSYTAMKIMKNKKIKCDIYTRVSNPNSVKRFVAAIDEADRDRTPKQTLPGRQLTNPQEILALMSKRKKQTLKY